MTFIRLFSLQFKDMLRKNEFRAAFLISMLLMVGSAVTDILILYQKDLTEVLPAWVYTDFAGLTNNEYYTTFMIMTFGLLLLPFLASLSYSYCYCDDTKTGVIKFILAKTKRSTYLLSSAVTSFVGSFLIISIPLLLNQALFCLAIPAEKVRPLAWCNFRSSDMGFEGVKIFKSILLNHPYGYNLLHIVILAGMAGLLGLLSFSLSLFIQKKIVVLVLPGILYILSFFMQGQEDSSFFLQSYLATHVSGTPTIAGYLLWAVGLLAVCVIATLCKIRLTKDEL